ncbi:MAG: hypothetical protein ABIY52_18835 [Gemmatimonadaceae bacterium]
MLRAFALLCFAAPFVAGGMRFISGRGDYRILAMAAAALAGTIVVWKVIRPQRRGALLVLALATALAAVVALLLGARSPVGVLMVAVVLAGANTAGYVTSMERRTG